MRAPGVLCVGSARGEVCKDAVAFARLAFLTSPSALAQIPSGSGSRPCLPPRRPPPPPCAGIPSSGLTNSFQIWLSLVPLLSPARRRVRPCPCLAPVLWWPPLLPRFAVGGLRLVRPRVPEALAAGLYPPAFSVPPGSPPAPLPPLVPPLLPALSHVIPPHPPPGPRGAAVMTGKRPRRGRAAERSAVPTPPEAPAELAPVLLRAAAALVAREGAGAPSRPREPVYHSPRGRTHPHLRARGGSFRRRRPPRPPLAPQRQIVGPHLSAPPPLDLQQSLLPPPLPSSQQSSQQQSSGPTASSPVVASPASTSAPQLSSGDAAPPLLPSPPPPLPAASPPPVEPPQRQHPLVLSGPAPEARFPPPRARSPELPPDAPDPEDDERWWNGELWESPPQPATLWGREWDIQCDVVKDILRWEKRMVAVGECMSHVATVLEQLHAGLVARNLVLRDPQLTEPQQGVVRAAAAQGLWRLLRLPLEPEFPEQDEGPGAWAFRRVAKAAEESPLELVPALAVLLRWMRRRFYVLNRV
ncbi:unnamed protein product [Closterium sp. Naga37s-1]|nr:unnamed protein product [Closterium sp. Naga37s-1]